MSRSVSVTIVVIISSRSREAVHSKQKPTSISKNTTLNTKCVCETQLQLGYTASQFAEGLGMKYAVKETVNSIQ